MRAYSIVLAVSLFCLYAQAVRDRQVTIIFTGDILLDRGVRKVIEKHGADHLFSKAVDSVFHASDMVVGNLECPATKIKAPVQKQFIFRAEPEWLRVLRSHGITHLNLANNHTIDQGREGLMDTRRNKNPVPHSDREIIKTDTPVSMKEIRDQLSHIPPQINHLREILPSPVRAPHHRPARKKKREKHPGHKKQEHH